MRHSTAGRTVVLGLVAAAVGLALGSAPAGAVEVDTGAELLAAFSDVTVTGIVVTADVEIGCEDGSRLGPDVPLLTIEGGGHTVAVTCAASGGTFQSHGSMTWRDIEILGPEAEAVPIIRGTRELVLDGAHLVGRNDFSVIQHTFEGTTTVIESTIESGPAGLAIESRAGTMVVERSRISGDGSGIDFAPGGGASGSGLVLRDSTIDVAFIGLNAGRSGVVERSSIHGGLGAVSFNGRRLVVTDSTFVGDHQSISTANGAALIIGRSSAVRLDQVTITSVAVAADEPSIVFIDDTSSLILGATVVDAPDGQQACGPGAVASEGDSVAADDSCGLDGPGDRVLADPGLGPFDPGTGVAAPVADGPLVDAVATCRSGSDQLGLSRPQGAACDVGAIELEAEVVPPTTSTSTTTPGGGTAPAATPVAGPARFAG